MWLEFYKLLIPAGSVSFLFSVTGPLTFLLIRQHQLWNDAYLRIATVTGPAALKQLLLWFN